MIAAAPTLTQRHTAPAALAHEWRARRHISAHGLAPSSQILPQAQHGFSHHNMSVRATLARSSRSTR